MNTILGSRKDHYLIGLSIFLMMVALIIGMVGCGYNPPPSQHLEIQTWYDLDAVRDNLRGNYILMNDLDSTTPGYDELAGPTANGGNGWKPIGWGGWVSTWFGVKAAGEVFKGSFDGQGYEIRDPHINGGGQVGLFGFVAGGAIIKNIALINATVTEGEAAGGLVGLNQDTVRCFDVAPVGGVGGLVGYNGGTVSNCHAMGNITGDLDIGGLVGCNEGTVSNCYATGSVTGNFAVGGLVGTNWGTVSNSYSSGNIAGNRCVGGLVGVNGPEKSVSNSYSTGNVTGNSSVGGLVGFNGIDGSVTRSYSTGSVTGDEVVGGLVGYGEGEGNVSNSFWDIETSGQSNSAAGTGKTTAQMKNIATFSGAGWNVIAVANSSTRDPACIWNIVDDVTYPFLSWQP